WEAREHLGRAELLLELRLLLLAGVGQLLGRHRDVPLHQALVHELEEDLAGENPAHEPGVEGALARAREVLAGLGQLLLDGLAVRLVVADGLELDVEVLLADAAVVDLGRVGGHGAAGRADERGDDGQEKEEFLHDAVDATEPASAGTRSRRKATRNSAGSAPRATGRTICPMSSL